MGRTWGDCHCLSGYLSLAHTYSQHAKVQKDGLLKTELAGSVPIDREYRALPLSKSLQSLEGEGEGP